MALRLRRGTNAERQLITPVEGELVWTTDTKELYAGDGTTVGGIKITGAEDAPRTELDELDDVTLGTVNNGDVLAYDMDLGVWKAAPAESPELQAGQLYNIGLLGDDSSILVDTSSNFFRGNFDGDLYDSEGNRLIDADGGFFYDKEGVEILDLNIRGGEFDLKGNVQGSVFNNNLTQILVDHDNETFYGTLQGDVVGNVIGSVFSDSSSTVIDGITGNVSTNLLTSTQIELANSGSFGGSVSAEFTGTAGSNILYRTTVSNNGAQVFTQQTRATNTYTTQTADGSTGTTMYSDSFIFDGLDVGIKQYNPTADLDINGVMRLRPQSSAPASPQDGMIASADRVNWDPAGKGSGASYPVYFDGSTWNALY